MAVDDDLFTTTNNVLTKSKDWATEAVIPEGITEIGAKAFKNCRGLSFVKLPSSIAKIGDFAFQKCKSLKDISFAGSVAEWESVKKGEGWWDGVTANAVRCSDGDWAMPVLKIVGSVVKELLAKNATSVTIPEGITEIDESAFEECESLESIIIPEGVKKIGNYAFYNCSSLAYIQLPNSIKKLGFGVFEDCSSLNKVSYCGTKEEWKLVKNGADAFDDTIKIQCTDGERFNLYIDNDTAEDISSCIKVYPGESNVWHLEYIRNTCDDSDREHVGFFGTKESALRYFLEEKLYENVRDDFMSAIEHAMEEDLCDDIQLSSDASIQDIRDSIDNSDGNLYCNFLYILSPVTDEDFLAEPQDDDAAVIEASGVSFLEENEEEDSNDYDDGNEYVYNDDDNENDGEYDDDNEYDD